MIKTYDNDTYQKGVTYKTETSVTMLIVSVIAGFITAGTDIAGLPSTLGIALAGSISFTGGVAVLAGSLIAYFVNGMISESVPQICSILTLVAISFIGNEMLSRKSSAARAAITSGALFAFYAFGIAFIREISVLIAVIITAQALLCGCSAYFISVFSSCFAKTKSISFSGIEGASAGVVYVLIIASLTSLSFWHLDVGRTAGIMIMLLAIKKYKAVGGAVCGILTSCGVILCSPQMGTTTMLLACAGLIAGLFGRFGAFAVVTVFTLSNFAGLLAIGISDDTFNMMFDVAVATVLYIIIPSKNINTLFETAGMSRFSGKTVAQNAGQKLDFASRTLQDVNVSFDRITDAIKQKSDKRTISERVAENICSHCPYKLGCWEKNYDRTQCAFAGAERTLEKTLSCEDAFNNDMSFCMQQEVLKDEFYSVFSQEKYNRSVAKRLKEMRGLLSDQFCAMQEMLSSLSAELSSYAFTDDDMSFKVREYFERRGIVNPKVCVYNNLYGYAEAEIYIPKEIALNDVNLCRDISAILDTDLELPQYYTVGGLTRIEMWEKPEYAVETGACQLCGSSCEMTGDSYEMFYDNRAQSFIVLSDGMGSGKRAQLDSLLTSSLVSRLLRAGIGYESAIRLVNSTMRVKSWEESFATVDIAIVNLYDATLNIIKSGGSATYVVRGDEIKKIEVSSLPVGILPDVEPKVISFSLIPDDIIILSSDGLVPGAAEILKKIAIANRHMTSKIISERMINAVRNCTKGERNDDITIIVSKISNNA